MALDNYRQVIHCNLSQNTLAVDYEETSAASKTVSMTGANPLSRHYD